MVSISLSGVSSFHIVFPFCALFVYAFTEANMKRCVRLILLIWSPLTWGFNVRFECCWSRQGSSLSQRNEGHFQFQCRSQSNTFKEYIVWFSLDGLFVLRIYQKLFYSVWGPPPHPLELHHLSIFWITLHFLLCDIMGSDYYGSNSIGYYGNALFDVPFLRATIRRGDQLLVGADEAQEACDWLFPPSTCTRLGTLFQQYILRKFDASSSVFFWSMYFWARAITTRVSTSLKKLIYTVALLLEISLLMVTNAVFSGCGWSTTFGSTRRLELCGALMATFSSMGEKHEKWLF